MVSFPTKIFTLCSVTIFLCVTSLNANNFFDDPLKKSGTIVLDPGHGGSNYGIKGVGGLYEKNITLKIANLIFKELEKNHNVFLTRTDDYKLSNVKRTSIANSKNADLFISIHTGGSLNKKSTGTRIYYYSQNLEINIKSHKDKNSLSNGSDGPVLWENVQLRHGIESLALARSIKNSMDPQTIITGSKIIILKGADMPSILLEIGFQTNTIEASRLSDEGLMKEYAKNFSKGIELFLKKREKND